MFRRIITSKPAENSIEELCLKILSEQRLPIRKITSLSQKGTLSANINNRSYSICANKNIQNMLCSSLMPISQHCLVTKYSLMIPQYIRCANFNSSAISNIDSTESSDKQNIFQKLYRKVIPERLSVSKSSLHRSGATLSACCTHEVDLQTFFEMFDMPDTYYSWWLVTELHAWMLSVRLSVGNSREGLFCRNQMVETIYTDMDERAKKVADMDRSARMNVVWDLAEEFKFAMLVYDLGLAGSDIDLANSIWRRFFLGKEDPDVEKIELLVKYVRKTIASLDQIDIMDLYLMEPGSALSWPDIKKLEVQRASQ